MEVKLLVWRVFVLFLVAHFHSLSSLQLENSRAWTQKLGDELWHLSQLVTKHQDLKSKYKYLNARVETNDGRSLLNQIVENVSKMVQRKIDTVKCIVNAAEEMKGKGMSYNESLKLDYYNMKFSAIEGSSHDPEIPYEAGNLTMYRNMSLSPDRNFYNIPVNTEYSAVHIPTNLYDRYPFVAKTINWTEGLDEVFWKNYHADPRLIWQYFGAASGMMRQFPAMQWKQESADMYDCRTRPWFIEAATCTKDMIILIDNSGSMTGMRNTIAKLVANSLLETFGNNDFINVLKFSWTAETVVPCFKDVLVQATPENVKLFQEAVAEIKPDGNSSFPNAFSAAFELLEKYRQSRGCENTTECNQAIMLVTDGLPGNITEVFEKHNRGENGSIPVRVFTYLVGNEVKGVQEIQIMACENRGYYVHIHNLDEVRDQVLKYIPVMARPLVLQEEEHPVVWTHTFADVSDPKVSTWLWEVMEEDEQNSRLLRHKAIIPEYIIEQREDEKYVQIITQVLGEEREVQYQEYRMMTSVSMPAFDKEERNDTRVAELLGIAGTDVPVDYFRALTYPYKIGANGYAFIVTNNGYLLMHPDLRPVSKGILKLNYNSVDLVQVEFADDESEYEEFNDTMLELREALIFKETASFLDVDVKFHYDNMRRVGTEKRDYYVSPLPDTQFSVGLAIPSDYGDYQISVGDEVQKSFYVGHTLDKYFKEKNQKDPEFKIHPDWTYCKYHYASHRKFNSPEDELIHILEKITPIGWNWTTEYPEDTSQSFTENNSEESECSRPEIKEDSFYCDKDLIQLLIFDARVTELFKSPKLAKNSFEEKQLIKYNTTLRFVATQSGLTRWQLIPKPKPGENASSNFGEAYPRAIDEPWFKAAVLQHSIDSESFVFSVPFNAADQEPDNVVITGTLVIFPKDGGLKAPASAVGFQFTHKSFRDRFAEITSAKMDENSHSCMIDSEESACYILDHNGYIILSSKNFTETGKFFGEFEGDVMKKLVDLKLFREIVIYDYQGLCIKEKLISSDASFLRSPVAFLQRLFQFVVGDILVSIFQTLVNQVYNLDLAVSVPVEEPDDDYDVYHAPQEEIEGKIDVQENETVTIVRESWHCDKKTTLYELQQKTANKEYSDERDESRLRFAKRIPYTNMILIVLHTLPLKEDNVVSAEAEVIEAELGLNCHRSNTTDLPRARLMNCFTDHPLEVEIEACGKGTLTTLNYIILICSIIMYVIF